MTSSKMNGTRRCAMLAVLGALAASSGAMADGPDHSASEDRDGFEHEHLDTRFSHNHSYHDQGYTLNRVPRGGYPVDRDQTHYWYNRGEWYRREASDWIVVSAPAGALVGALPLFYTTVVLDGVRYYYANDTYYVWNGGAQEYQVVAPPAGIDSAGSAQPAPDGQLFVYPRNAVSPEQQASDRYQCDTSAADETGFDPTKEDGGVPADRQASKRADYFRAEAACLAVRGYRVR